MFNKKIIIFSYSILIPNGCRSFDTPSLFPTKVRKKLIFKFFFNFSYFLKIKIAIFVFVGSTPIFRCFFYVIRQDIWCVRQKFSGSGESRRSVRK